ncbi:MAG: hypothetical protein ACOY7U_12075 [Acidobacteriota bacterium]
MNLIQQFQKVHESGQLDPLTGILPKFRQTIAIAGKRMDQFRFFPKMHFGRPMPEFLRVLGAV